jgi:hypothetical protein
MEVLPFFVSKSVPDSKVITVWRLRGDPDTKVVYSIELEKALKECFMFLVECGVKM